MDSNAEPAFLFFSHFVIRIGTHHYSYIYLVSMHHFRADISNQHTAQRATTKTATSAYVKS